MKTFNVNKVVNFSPLFLVIALLCMTIGFSAFTSNPMIVAKAKVDPVIAMQIINFAETTGANHGGASNYESHNIDIATTGAYLPYSDSTIVYQIELINLGTDPNGIFAVTGLPSNLQYSFSDYTEQDKICDANTPSNCSKLARRTITMTISYKQNGYNSRTTTYPLTLNFDFRAFHNISYNGFSGTYRDYVIDGGNLNITFNSGDIPSAVGVVGATNSYTSPTLSLTSVASDVTITKKYNITYSGFSGNTSSLPSSINYSGGSITFDNTSGIPSNVTVTGATGSYASPTLTLSNITGDITITAAAAANKAYLFIQDIYNNSTPSEDSSCDNSLTPDDTSDSNLRYIGSKPCNYIYFNNTNWRIVGIFNVNGENLLKIVNPTVYSSSVKFNNNNGGGKQIWGANQLATTLNDTFYQQLTTNGYDTFVQSVPWNTGGPASNVSTPNAFYTAEISAHSASNYNVGLLNISDIAYATSGPTNGNRSTCLNATMNTWNNTNVGCVVSNAIVNDWLFLGENEWTVDTRSGQSQVYRMQNNGIPYQASMNTSSNARTVVYLKENIKFDSGNGSSSTPYRISLTS